MALIECPECSESVSTKAAACPHCGYQIDPVEMPSHESTAKQSSRNLKLIGALMTFVAIPGCIVTTSSDSSSGTGVWVVVFVIGFITFLMGRFQD
jgi:hypothetical protein